MWILTPLRKFSPGNKAPTTTKKGSYIKFKVSPINEVTKSIPNEDEQNGEELKFPPVMKPISESILVNASDVASVTSQRTSGLSAEVTASSSADLAEIEQIVKDRMEQHIITTATTSSIDKSGYKFSLKINGDSKENALTKRDYVMRELVYTENEYVNHLSMIVDDYMSEMKDAHCDKPVPEDLKSGKVKIIFGNIELIYEWHRETFFSVIKHCVTHPHEFGKQFKKYECKLLNMYVTYCRNKSMSEYIVSEHEEYFEEMRLFFGHKLSLGDMLIKPVQRIMKYQLLLRDMFKYTERAKLVDQMEALQQAINVMQMIPKAANDMMDVSRLQGFDGNIITQGKLLMHSMLTCTEGPGNNSNRVVQKDLHVFLFEQCILFSEEMGKKKEFTSPMYVYKAHIQVNKMMINDSLSNSNSSGDLSDESFIIKSIDPKRPPLWFVCHAHSVESQSKWLQNLRQILQKQQDFLSAFESPVQYLNQSIKDAS